MILQQDRQGEQSKLTKEKNSEQEEEEGEQKKEQEFSTTQDRHMYYPLVKAKQNNDKKERQDKKGERQKEEADTETEDKNRQQEERGIQGRRGRNDMLEAYMDAIEASQSTHPEKWEGKGHDREQQEDVQVATRKEGQERPGNQGPHNKYHNENRSRYGYPYPRTHITHEQKAEHFPNLFQRIQGPVDDESDESDGECPPDCATRQAKNNTNHGGRPQEVRQTKRGHATRATDNRQRQPEGRGEEGGETGRRGRGAGTAGRGEQEAKGGGGHHQG